MPVWKCTPQTRARARLKELFEDFEEAKYGVRLSLARAAWDDSEIRACLAQLLEDPDSDIRFKASFIAGVVVEENPELIRTLSPQLLMLLEDTSIHWVEIHSWSKRALLYIARDDPAILRDAIPKLVKRLAHRDEWEWDRDLPGFNAAASLARIAEMAPEVMRSFIPQLLDLLRHPEDHVRSSTALAVGMIGEKEPELVQPCLAELIDLLGDRSGHARYAAATAIGFVGQMHPELVSEAIPKWVNMLRDSDKRLLDRALYEIRRIADTDPRAVVSATPALLKLVKGSEPDVREAAEAVLQRISARR